MNESLQSLSAERDALKACLQQIQKLCHTPGPSRSVDYYTARLVRIEELVREAKV